MSNRFQGSRSEVRALSTYVKLVRATETASGRIHRHLSEDGLTTGQFGVLEALLHLGPLNPCVLAQKHLQSSGNVTMIVDNLEKRGLVRREPSKEDRRRIMVHLTEEGERLIREIFPRHAHAVEVEMNRLSPEEQEELGRLCRKLGVGDADVNQ
ncbi:MAG: MarR family transcriptional regulator, and catechol-resistance regulon repressor [Abditibacteriota bacterium]|jgi:MarR family 2-MHQ and catechol resistance regulon transcriptional repressor|nr:MarR family transcriptional regulator, and catechol-resistance regulon repressor [Abditibacteriota bacterium]